MWPNILPVWWLRSHILAWLVQLRARWLSDLPVPLPLEAPSSQADDSWKCPIISARPRFSPRRNCAWSRACVCDVVSKLWYSFLQHEACLWLCERGKTPATVPPSANQLTFQVFGTPHLNLFICMVTTHFPGINPHILLFFLCPPSPPPKSPYSTQAKGNQELLDRLIIHRDKQTRKEKKNRAKDQKRQLFVGNHLVERTLKERKPFENNFH